MDIPPWALNVISKLPASTQEKLQAFLMKAMQDPYVVSLATIPLALYLAYIPHFVKFGLMAANKGANYNNETPRTEDLKSYGLLPGVMIRCSAAHLNALEGFPFFATAVLIARIQKVNPMQLGKLCLRYLALRVAYTFCYIFGVNKFVALLRTLVWGSAMGVVSEIAFLGL